MREILCGQSSLDSSRKNSPSPNHNKEPTEPISPLMDIQDMKHQMAMMEARGRGQEGFVTSATNIDKDL